MINFMKKDDCVFCQKPKNEWILKNQLAAAFWDINPVNPGHLLIISQEHHSNYFDLSAAELIAVNQLLKIANLFLDLKYHHDVYNILINNGHFGGQSIMHCHIHLIPRYKNDGLFMPKNKSLK